MEIQLWRNATVLLNMNGLKFLIDPMLGAKGSLGAFPWTNDKRLNPLTELPFTPHELDRHLTSIDAVVVSHLHPDHWDTAAVQLLRKDLPVICPGIISKPIADHGFKNVISMDTNEIFHGVTISLTKGQHGTGEIGEKMGLVNGFVFSTPEESIYFTGDTIWCEDVREAIETHNPRYVVVAGGAATFALGNPVTMTAEDILSLCKFFPRVKVLVTHLEAISPCREDREYISRQIAANGFSENCTILRDGEKCVLS